MRDMSTHHDPALVVLSVAIAIVVSYAALDLSLLAAVWRSRGDPLDRPGRTEAGPERRVAARPRDRRQLSLPMQR